MYENSERKKKKHSALFSLIQQVCIEMSHCAILGDSFVKRLRKYCKGRLGTKRIRMFGYGGLTAAELRDSKYLLDRATRHRPHTVLLSIGGNDLADGKSADDVEDDLWHIVDYLTQKRRVQHIIIAEVTPRNKFRIKEMTPDIFNTSRRALSNRLKKSTFPASYMFVKKLKFPDDFDKDGVHLGEERDGKRGQQKFYQFARKVLRL